MSEFSREWNTEFVIQLRGKVRSHDLGMAEAKETAAKALAAFRRDLERMLPHECWVEFGYLLGEPELQKEG
jgi:hypothetical protein